MVPLLVALLAVPPAAETATGTVRLTKGVGDQKLVSLSVEGQNMRLEGELVVEVARLQSATVEVVGQRRDDTFVVQTYRILDVGGGARPLVGTLEEADGNLVLRDGSGPDLPLSLPPRSRERLSDKAGAKLWVHGTKLLSGELKVLKYGILRDPPPKAVQP